VCQYPSAGIPTHIALLLGTTAVYSLDPLLLAVKPASLLAPCSMLSFSSNLFLLPIFVLFPRTAEIQVQWLVLAAAPAGLRLGFRLSAHLVTPFQHISSSHLHPELTELVNIIV